MTNHFRRLMPLLVGVMVFLIYLLTTPLTVQAGDSAELTLSAYTLGISHAPGYPLYTLVAHAISRVPLGTVAFRVNLLSGLFGAITVACLYIVINTFTDDDLIAVVGSLAFGLCLPAWSLATRAEVYTMQTALLAGSLALLAQETRPATIAAIALYGVTLAHRPVDLLALPGLLVIAGWGGDPGQRPGWKTMLTGLVLMPVHVVWILYLPIRAATNPVINFTAYYDVDLTTFDGVWWMVSGAPFRGFFMGFASFSAYSVALGETLSVIGRVWTLSAVPVLVIGGWWLWRERRGWLIGLLVIWLPMLLVYAGYRVPDRAEMLLPAILIMTILLGVGLHGGRMLLSNVQAARFATPVMLVLVAALGVGSVQTLLSHDRDAVQRRAAKTLEALPPDAMLVADWYDEMPIRYLQEVHGLRQDVMTFNWGLFRIARLLDYRAQGLPPGIADEFALSDLRTTLSKLGETYPLYVDSPYREIRNYIIMEEENGVYQLIIQ